MPGKLYIVSTPIGNLGDITERAKEVLGNVDLVAAEDTRRTGRLLKLVGAETRLLSYHDHNKERRVPQIVETLLDDRDVALVTDAGTPLISDPGYRIVEAAIEAECFVTAIPGPSACLAALVVSGLPTDRFVFEGYLPKKPGRRGKRVEELGREIRTLVLYETPHRIAAVLEELAQAWGERRGSVSRELTKKFEETIRGTLPELALHWQNKRPQGEFVLVVEGLRRQDDNESG